jgi:16S rRNA (cytidine1402-2'-O)-methyltransferase
VLILAATPIGNLGDASPRLIESITEAAYIAAEDTRTLIKLAQALKIQITAKLFSLHEHNEINRVKELAQLATEQDLLVVSDAGMPTVSDPGYVLVREVIALGGAVTVIPGPSAVISALAISGLPTDRFTFEGFLPRKSGDRRNVFGQLATESRTMIFFESPHRIHESLTDAAAVFGSDRKAAVVRELTKKFEEAVRGPLADLVAWSASEVRGELVLIVAGAVEASKASVEDLVPQVRALISENLRVKEAVSEIANSNGVSKSELYAAVLASREAESLAK